jgi:hypothetical protein
MRKNVNKVNRTGFRSELVAIGDFYDTTEEPVPT